MASMLFEDHEVDYIRSVLGAAYSYLHALDLADSQRAVLKEVRESALAVEVRDCLAEIEAKQGRFELQRRDGVLPQEPEEDNEGDFLDDDEDEDDEDDA